LWHPIKKEIVITAKALFDRLQSLPTNDSGLMLWNWGAHCNKPGVGCIDHVLNQALLPVTQHAGFRNWKMMFRETEPQHFDNPTGLYQIERPFELQCGNVDHPSPWRNIEAHQFLIRNELLRRVAWVPLFDRLLPFTYTFHYPADCTHYCYSPWRLELTWDGVVHGLRYLKMIDEEGKAKATSKQGMKLFTLFEQQTSKKHHDERF